MPEITSPLLDATAENDTLVVSLRGDWDIRTRPPGFEFLMKAIPRGYQPARIRFEPAELGTYDSSLISLLLQIHRQCEDSGCQFERDSLPAGGRELHPGAHIDSASQCDIVSQPHGDSHGHLYPRADIFSYTVGHR